MPLVNALLQHAEHLRGLDVPQGLVRLPGLHVLFSSIKLLLECGVAKVEAILVHLENQVLICLVTFCRQILLILAELLIPVRIDPLQPAYDFELLVKPLVPESACLRNGRVKDYCLVLDLDLEHCFVIDKLSSCL